MVPPRLFTTASVAAVLALALACNSTPDSPISPSSASPGEANAVGDLTLKANAPTLVAPDHDVEFDGSSDVTLQFQAARATYIDTPPEHQIQIFDSNGQLVYQQTVGGVGTISHQLPGVPGGSYDWQVRAVVADGAGPWSELRRFTMRSGGSSAGGSRTPNPPPGARLPAPNRFNVVVAVANQYPHFLARSCQEHGGTWDFMDTVIDILRAEDTRWGYAWKRGIVGNPLLEVVAYNWSSDPDEGTRNIYTIDIIAGHCGSSPRPTWSNTQPSGGPGQSVWTGRGRF